MKRDRSPYLNSDREKPHADWVAWSLQLVFGCFVGAGVGFMIARWLVRFHFTGFGHMLFVSAGVSLCCGAYTLYHGDRAWTTPSIFAPDEPMLTRQSRNWSRFIGTIGVGLIILPLILHRITRDRTARESTSIGFSLLLLPMAAIPGFLLVHALRTGTGLWRWGIIDREETPLLFWIYVVLNAFALLCILSAIF